MSIVLENLGQFFTVALVAIFVQNIIFTRAMGVSRLIKLVSDSGTDMFVFCALLCLIQVMCAPRAYFANKWLSSPQIWYREYIRPLVLTLCAVLVFIVILVVVTRIKPGNTKEILSALPMAVFICAVLGPMLLIGTENYTLVQSMGFALGSGLGYGFAAILVTEGQRKLNNRNVPTIFKGLPINLIYIGILAIAIYALTGYDMAL